MSSIFETKEELLFNTFYSLDALVSSNFLVDASEGLFLATYTGLIDLSELKLFLIIFSPIVYMFVNSDARLLYTSFLRQQIEKLGN